MDWKTMFAVLLNAAFINNLMMHRLLAVEESQPKAVSILDTVKNWAHVSAVLAVSALACFALEKYVLAALGLEYFAQLAFLLVIFAVSAVYKRLAHLERDEYLAVFVTGAVELVCLSLCADGAMGFGEFIMSLLGVCLGYLLAALVFDGLRTRIKMAYVPRAFRNVTIYFLALELMSLAALAF